MLNYFTPIVMYCAIVTGDLSSKCDAVNKFFSETLDPVPTPTKCLLEGSIRAMEFVDLWKKEHQNKPIDYRIRCESSAKRT